VNGRPGAMVLDPSEPLIGVLALDCVWEESEVGATVPIHCRTAPWSSGNAGRKRTRRLRPQSARSRLRLVARRRTVLP
jgi:hypothetical protein